MLIDVEILHVLQRADNGCPKCQYIMADYYQNGIGVPKDREKAKRYYRLLASHSPESLAFMDEDYSILLAFIGHLHFNDREYEDSRKYLTLAMFHIRENFPPKEAEERMLKSHIHRFLEEIILRS